ncbi:VOC family protein [Synechococcus sp. PCC 6717]|jgi:extradiol dioxygenase family protein|uniref:Glyoxalase n=1 Tax=Parathermosynechococcus lividus PCC 6715 TaxID=1917166 RepID=A0A2D2Q303_PARLV|nr:VOC family protein [Thermostichus lividus]ATS18876.1 glyoxalase [Thermostichus lividus PCC 6715]MCH9055567.1 VOC family protein [Synechococcus sp. PCC 6716]MCI3280555.1 VOC family protein [Synechococcus sp. PCC 6717]
MAQLAIAPVLFHLAFPVSNIPETKAFYVEGLGCEPGRENPHCLIMKLYGHQLVAHVTSEPLTPPSSIYPRHFGLIFLAEADWQNLRDRVVAKELGFYQPPRTRFVNTPLEHKTFFLADPFHNLIEIKFYRHAEAIFGNRDQHAVGDTPLISTP